MLHVSEKTLQKFEVKLRSKFKLKNTRGIVQSGNMEQEEVAAATSSDQVS